MNVANLYQQTAVTTQNRGRLIVLLYDGAIKFLRQAVVNLQANDFQAKGRNIRKAQDIILELNTVLDMENGGEIASNLRSLYNFMNRHLTQATIKNDPDLIQDVIRILETLNQSWKSITA
ncbi:MAG: flagellar export chaperone FliS [Phycisphaerae bacterium]|nr:flagellar export chaperone FliS [Phycisphaerae bacterium]